MPCRDPYPFEEPYEVPASRKSRTETSSEQISNNIKLYGLAETDEDLPGSLMEIACHAFTELENALDDLENEGLDKEFPSLYESWWENHKLRDAQRMEEVKKRALAKLTDEEKRALGLVAVDVAC
jgi:hypothetical protein